MIIYNETAAMTLPMIQEPLFALRLCGTFTRNELSTLIASSHGHCFALYLSKEMTTVPDDFLNGIPLPEYIVIPEGVTALGCMTLLPSVRIRQLCLPSTLRIIHAESFPAGQIERIRFPKGSDYFRYDGGKIISKNDGTLVCRDSHFVPPEDVFRRAATAVLTKQKKVRLAGMRKAAEAAKQHI